MHGRLAAWLGIAVGLVAALAFATPAAAHGSEEEKTAGGATAQVQLTIVGIEYEGTKLWLPSTIVARKGDRVKLTLLNKIASEPSQHGFAIDAFKVAEVVTRGEPKTTEFIADKTGVFPIHCQLHPAHVGGQLIVLDAAH